MSDVFCKCGYEGNQVVEFSTKTPTRQLKETHYYGYFDYVKTLTNGIETLNWACPKCGKILIQQKGGLSYNRIELNPMFQRLYQNSRDNERWYKAQQNKNLIKQTKIVNQIKKHEMAIADLNLQLKESN